MENEILACIKDSEIKYLHSGQLTKHIFPMERKAAHKKKVSHLIVRVFAISFSSDDEPIFLVQKRSSKKLTYPGYFTDSASGHVHYKKNLKIKDIEQDAKRELGEEMGIEPNSVKNVSFYSLKTEKNGDTNEISYIFLMQLENGIKLNPNPDEVAVSSSRFYSKTELRSILKNKKAIDYSKEIWIELINKDLRKYFRESKSYTYNPNEIAFFIGRFQPLHHGHIYVLKRLFEIYEKVKIGIGSSQLSYKFNDPFTNAERREFIQAALKKRDIAPSKYEIYSIPDIFDAERWVDHVLSIINHVDVIYSNSEWVRQLFKLKGYELGKKIEIFKKKYNGANIRKLIATKNKNWKPLVPKEVREIINKYNGVERIQTLYKKIKNNNV